MMNKLFLGVILISAIFSCRSTYDFRGDSNNRWVPNLETSQNEKSTRNYEKSALAKTEVQKINEEISANNSLPIVSSVSKDTFTQKVTKKAEQLERRLIALTVNTAHLIPQKFSRVIANKTKTKMPGFLTYKCRSQGMTIGYRIMVYGFLAMILCLLIFVLDIYVLNIGLGFGPIFVFFGCLFIVPIGFLIWLFSLIVPSLTQ